MGTDFPPRDDQDPDDRPREADGTSAPSRADPLRAGSTRADPAGAEPVGADPAGADRSGDGPGCPDPERAALDRSAPPQPAPPPFGAPPAPGYAPEFDPELMAYADGQLGPEEAAAVEARLAACPEARAAVAAWTGQARAIRDAARALDTGPASLKTAALERALAQALQRQGWRARLMGPMVGTGLRRLAAGVMLFAAGWGAHWVHEGATTPYPGYVAEGLGAHQVFANDRLRPVEFTAQATAGALDWVSAKLDRKLSHPALEPLGLELVGTRMLGNREGPMAQFIYEDRDGHRLSLILAPHPEGTPAAPLRMAHWGEERVGYWRDTQLDYAVVAQTSDLQIRAIAEEVSKLMDPG